MNYLEFEKPLAEIEGKAEELRAMARANKEMDVEKEAAALDRKAETMLQGPLQGLDALAEMPGRAPSRPAALQGLYRRRCSPNSRRWQVTGTLPTTMRSWVGWHVSTTCR